MSRFTTAAIPLLLVVSVLACPSTTAARQDASSLEGVWVLNAAATDDLDELAAEADEAAARAAGERPSVRVRIGGGGVYPNRGFGAPRQFDPALLKLAVDAVKDPSARVSIALAGDTVLVARGDSAPEAFVVDGKTVKRSWLDDPEAEIRAEWKDGGLRIRRELENDLEFEERWAIEPATGRLIVTIEIDGPITRRIEVKRVYDPATPSPLRPSASRSPDRPTPPARRE